MIVALHLTNTLTVAARGRGWWALDFVDQEKARAVWGFLGSGVGLFFVLSGFLLFMPYIRSMLGLTNFPSTANFYRKRALRILPGYWASLLLIITLVAPGYVTKPDKWPHVFIHFFLVHNFDPATWGTINPVYWSLAIEAQFYLLLPLLALALISVGKRWGWRGLAVMLAMLAALTPLSYLLNSATQTTDNTFSPLFAVAAFLHSSVNFVVGIACSIIYIIATEQSEQGWLTLEWAQRIARRVSVAALLLYAILIVFTVWFRPSALLDWFNGVFREVVTASIYGGILLGVMLGWRSWARLFSNRLLLFAGGISFSLYLLNEPITRTRIVPFVIGFPSQWLAILVGVGMIICITLPLTFIFYTLFERPFMMLRLRRFPRSERPQPAPLTPAPASSAVGFVPEPLAGPRVAERS